VIVVK